MSSIASASLDDSLNDTLPGVLTSDSSVVVATSQAMFKRNIDVIIKVSMKFLIEPSLSWFT